MKYRHKTFPQCGARNGFAIICPDDRWMTDISPVSIVKELNRLLRRIKQLEKEAKP